MEHMESIISFFQSITSFAVPMIVLLGLLIFVHEMGHFLVAKYFKVRVEVFSLGFGPKLFKFKRGDTVYAISAIPLGGYVKMFGDDPTADVASDQKPHSFLHKPVGQRIAVVLAGPLMNFFFAIVLFAGVAMIGEQALAPKLGDITPESAAHAAGFRSGDTVVSAAGQNVKTWDDFQAIVEKNADQKVPVVVDRSGAQATLEVTPKLGTNKNVLSWDRAVGEVDGLTYSSKASAIGIADPKSAAYAAGLRTGDVVASVNGEKTAKWRELIAAIEKHSATGQLDLEVERGILDEKKEGTSTMKIALPLPESAKGQTADKALASVGIEYPELYLAGIEKGSPAEKAGLQKGDRLLSINGQALNSFDQVATIIRSFGQDPSNVHREGASEKKAVVDPLSFAVLRNGETVTVALAPNMKERMSPQGREEKRFEIGIRPLILEAVPSTLELVSENPVQAVTRGFQQTMKWTSLTVLSFVRLFQAEVSPKNIGGFLSIGQMAKKSWQIGPAQFLNIMAIISINLFILNLLPVPVLDGGHLVFYTIEAVKGAPLSLRKMEIAQQVGLVLLLGLMVFALFNDVTRLVFN